jgi:putative transposase
VGALPEKVDAQRHHAAQLTARSNIFVERFWRSIKYEEVYLHAYDSVSQAKAGIARYIDFFNTARPHSSLDKQTPDEFYFATLPAMKQAA